MYRSPFPRVIYICHWRESNNWPKRLTSLNVLYFILLEMYLSQLNRFLLAYLLLLKMSTAPFLLSWVDFFYLSVISKSSNIVDQCVPLLYRELYIYVYKPIYRSLHSATDRRIRRFANSNLLFCNFLKETSSLNSMKNFELFIWIYE